MYILVDLLVYISEGEEMIKVIETVAAKKVF